MSTVSVDTHFSLFNIFNEKNMYDNIYNNPKRKGKSTSNHSGNWNSIYSIMSLYASSNNFSLSDMSYLAVSDSLIQSVALMHFYSKKYAYN